VLSVLPLSPLDLELILRVLLSFVLGGVLGYEREQSGRPAGLRTHMLVCAGSVCFTVAGIYGFQSVENGPRDPARVAAQVVSPCADSRPPPRSGWWLAPACDDGDDSED
jgi:uncharacterized membrane protein YhiD involved in acid resistance